MKKSIIAILVVTLMVTMSLNVAACPLWECNYGYNDYSCGCSGCGYQGGYQYGCQYNYQARQPIYCQYCGHEAWDCVCNYDCNYDYNYDCNYNSSYGAYMAHWANMRDEWGNIIAYVECGSYVEVYGEDYANPGRVLIYDYSTGCYGSVLYECVYGGYVWDGGYDYDCEYDYDYDCGYDYDCDYDYDYCDDYDYDCGGCGYGSGYSGAYAQYCETVVQRCVTYGFGYGYGYGFGGCWQ